MTDEKKFKILLAEDDEFISKAYVGGLQRAGYEVALATDGNQAMELLKTSPPDLFLLDVIMPEKNGFEVLTEIKAQEEYRDIPVIILSNLGQDTDIQKGLQLGAVDYMIKANYSMAEVIKKIEQYLQNK